MIRVLVVEDEPPLLRSICQNIIKANSHFEVVATAYNGKDALSILDKYNIDVIFTDIMMPLMTGLELLEIVSKKYPNVLTILLSGYQEFSYAQMAIKHGAYDYLLKPLENELLIALLSNIYENFSATQQENINNYLSDTLHNITPPQTSSIFSIDSFYIITICAGFTPHLVTDYINITRTFWNNIQLDDLLKKILTPNNFFWVITGKTYSDKIIILDVDDSNILHTICQFLYDELQHALPITLIYDVQKHILKDIRKTYDYMMQILHHNVIFSKSQLIILENALPLPTQEYFLPDFIENKLILALKHNNFNDFSKELFTLEKYLSSLEITHLNIENIFKYITFLVKKYRVTQPITSNLESEIKEIIYNTYTYPELIKQYLEILNEYFEPLPSINMKNKYELMQQIETFIQQNITQSITNQMLSDQFGLVPTYLSKLFKNYKGMSPAEYILKLRIEKAKELLECNPDLFAKDVAEIIGYSDPLYFSRVFKKETGVYPSQYRNLLHT